MHCSIWDSSFQQKENLSASNHRLQNFISLIPSLCQDFSMTTAASRGIKVVIKHKCNPQPSAGGVSGDALSPACKPTTALMIFHFLSPLLRLFNKVPTGSVQYGDGDSVFLCKCELECQEYLGTLSPHPPPPSRIPGIGKSTPEVSPRRGIWL